LLVVKYAPSTRETQPSVPTPGTARHITGKAVFL